MSTTVNNTHIGIFPAANANLVRYTAVKLVAGEVTTAGAAEQAFGICDLDGALAGQAVQVQVSGIAKVLASGNIAAGLRVTIDAAGKISAAAADDEFILGQLLDSVVAGQVGRVYLTKNTTKVTSA